jgi:hypothetical protein
MLDLEGARPHIEAALSYGGHTHTFDDVREMIERGEAIFWPGPNSAIITQVIEQPQLRTLHFFLAGGNLAELEAMLPGICEWGRKERGCKYATLTGRKGWERTFLTKREGWKSNLVVMSKEL